MNMKYAIRRFAMLAAIAPLLAVATSAVSPNEVAVVFDPDQTRGQGIPGRGGAERAFDDIVAPSLKAMNFGGSAYDALTVKAYLESGARYKAVMFLNLFETTPAQRQTIRSKLASAGSAAYWCFAPKASDIKVTRRA